MNQETGFANNPSLLFLQLMVVKAHLTLIIRLHAKGAEKHLRAHCFTYQDKNVFLLFSGNKSMFFASYYRKN